MAMDRTRGLSASIAARDVSARLFKFTGFSFLPKSEQA